ncbi:PIF1 helicase, putative [Medicago truncatula]|uniref:PIF1 helicase, putative n=1 Tax=Medicago truncatula TaxID=3880 RepID=G7L9E2_MEDTR|nr:PIF1 helicase, putative [Medicago truncatula]
MLTPNLLIFLYIKVNPLDCIYLPMFTHGQLYVAVSRVTTKQGLKMLILDEYGIPCNSTVNVVFPEVFENL